MNDRRRMLSALDETTHYKRQLDAWRLLVGDIDFEIINQTAVKLSMAPKVAMTYLLIEQLCGTPRAEQFVLDLKTASLL